MDGEIDTNRGPSHPFFATVYDPLMALFEQTLLRPHRAYLVEDLQGAVLDVGAGTGAMFPYFATVADESTKFSAIEPDPYMRRQARQQADDVHLDVDIRSGTAESLPYEDNSFDVVIAAMVFCTIPDVETALSEVSRILKPGGEFHFFEHVLDDGWRARVQRLIAPLWKQVAGGCHLTRQTASTFASQRSFDVVEMERLNLGVTPIRPFVRGTLRKRTSPSTRP